VSLEGGLALFVNLQAVLLRGGLLRTFDRRMPRDHRLLDGLRSAQGIVARSIDGS